MPRLSPALGAGLAAVLLAPSLPATTACDWEATRKRNEQEHECFRLLGPTTATWSLAPEQQAKLEACLMRTKTTHILERAECAARAEQMAETLEKER